MRGRIGPAWLVSFLYGEEEAPARNEPVVVQTNSEREVKSFDRQGWRGVARIAALSDCRGPLDVRPPVGSRRRRRGCEADDRSGCARQAARLVEPLTRPCMRSI